MVAVRAPKRLFNKISALRSSVVGIMLGGLRVPSVRVDWFNNHRLLEPIGNIPPAEAEARFYTQIEELDVVA